MPGRLPAAPIPSSGWELAGDADPNAFYRGETATDAPPATTELCQTIRDRIRKRLNERVRDLDVEVTGTSIVLSGRCATFHTKQLAQHAALGVLNDETLENRIEVLVP